MTQMPDPVDPMTVDFKDVEQKSLADLVSRADAGDEEAKEIVIPDTEAKAVVLDVVQTPENKQPGLLRKIGEAIGLVKPEEPQQPELPVQPLPHHGPYFLQTGKVVAEVPAEVQTAIAVAEAQHREQVRLQIKCLATVRIQKREAHDGTEVFRVHRDGDRFWHWCPNYADAKRIAESLFTADCLWEDCGEPAI